MTQYLFYVSHDEIDAMGDHSDCLQSKSVNIFVHLMRELSDIAQICLTLAPSRQLMAIKQNKRVEPVSMGHRRSAFFYASSNLFQMFSVKQTVLNLFINSTAYEQMNLLVKRASPSRTYDVGAIA